MDINTLIQQAMGDLHKINKIIADNQALAKQGPYGPATTASINRTLEHARAVKGKMLTHIEKLDTIRKEIAEANKTDQQRMLEEAARRAKFIGILLGSAATIAIIAASYLIYKRFFSKAAKACAGKKGEDREMCVAKFKIAGYEHSIKSLRGKLYLCGHNEKTATCTAKIYKQINTYEDRIRKQKSKLKENVVMHNITECYLNYLYGDESFIENDIRGDNLPVEHDDRPNWIRECMMLEQDREKINCLRKLRETTAMNPFYKYRIDRFVDAITQNYDPSGNNGMVPEVQE